MKALLSAAVVLGLAAAFSLAEEAPISPRPTAPDELQMKSEQVLTDVGPLAGRNGNKNARHRQSGECDRSLRCR